MGEKKSKFDLWDALGAEVEEAYRGLVLDWIEAEMSRRGADEHITTELVGPRGYGMGVVFITHSDDKTKLEAGVVAVSDVVSSDGGECRVCVIMRFVPFKEVVVFPGGPYLLEAEYLIEQMLTVWEEA